MAIKTLRVFAEFTSTGFVPMPTLAGIDYGFTVANTYPVTQPSTFQTDNPDLVVTVTALTDFYVWIRLSGTDWNPSYTRNVRVYPDSPDINSVVMNMIISTGPAGIGAYTQIVQTANRLYFNGATTDSVYNSKFAGKTYLNELNFGTAPQLATVATSGAYADLTGKPALASVATSGLYADLSSKPSGTAPISYNSGTNSFQITQANTSTNGFLSSTDWNTFNNKYLLPSGGTTIQYIRGNGTLATFPTTLDSTRLIMSGRNTTGTTLTKGTVVYINGVSGNTPLFARALATGDSTSAQTIGVVEVDIANNATGVVVLVGLVGNLDTSSFTEGVQLYLSGTTAGAFTSSKILAPTHLVYVGIVTRAHPTLGTIEVKIQNGYELDEIHDVAITSLVDKDVIYRDVATNLWKNASVSNVLGFTPYNATNPSNFIARTALSASTPLSYNNTTGAFSIAQANGTTNGFLSSSDWTTFNSKQSALTIGNFTEVNSNVFMFPDGGTGKTIGNLTIQMIQAGASTNGFLSSTDWTTFNNKQANLGFTPIQFSSLSASAPLAYNNTTGAFSITQASTTTNGFLGTTDWNTFNNKQNTITLTTTGTSGAATFSGGTLNIPQYQAALTNLVTGTGTINYVTKWTSSSAIGNSQIFDNGTNVGIGTASPATKLEVNGRIRISSSFSSAGTTNMDIYNASSTGFGMYIGAGSGTNYAFKVADYTNTDRFTVLGNGNVGIGITAPSQPLSVEDIILIKDSGSSASQLIFGDAANDFAGRIFYNHGSDAMQFFVNADERMRITSDGKVGIGTSSPGEQLTLSRASYPTVKLIDTTDSAQGYFQYHTDANEFRLVAQTSHPLIFSTNDTERMRINSDGKVRINTTSNAFGENLTVNGWITSGNLTRIGLFGEDGNTVVVGSFSNHDLVFRSNNLDRGRMTSDGLLIVGNTVGNGSRLFVQGSITATGNITANSDLTLKKNLKLIDNPAEKLMSLNGYSYQWKENDEYQYGVIAQEVEKVMSYAVQTGSNGIKGVAYNQLTPLLIEGFKLHNQKIDLNTSEITQLKERVKYLEAKLA